MLAGLGLLLLTVGQCLSDPRPPQADIGAYAVQLTSGAETKNYGLLLAAPADGCRRVRYRVETPARVVLGRSPELSPGGMAVVRIGNGFAVGAHVLIVRGDGCTKAPGLARRVTLRKLSPDHGWRAAPAATLLQVSR
jgi:hypothetical protein